MRANFGIWKLFGGPENQYLIKVYHMLNHSDSRSVSEARIHNKKMYPVRTAKSI